MPSNACKKFLLNTDYRTWRLTDNGVRVGPQSPRLVRSPSDDQQVRSARFGGGTNHLGGFTLLNEDVVNLRPRLVKQALDLAAFLAGVPCMHRMHDAQPGLKIVGG